MKQRVVRRQELVCDACYAAQEIERVHEGLVGMRCATCDSVMFTRANYETWRKVRLRLKLQEIFVKALALFGLHRRSGGVAIRTTINDTDVVVRMREGGLL
ncbi:hypothetical protein [Rhizobium laguerreae]|uniref:hypothetical protein n=1 Tax=Rhizobium laguerreae TaxID=1076926 RepID=UPI001C924FB0|nr:hypothetical protein [Rhizobium laguerreae]MBY3231950.1 hypothetical protein [Rhizobium laguerreae]